MRTRFVRPARRRVALGPARGREPCPSRHASRALGTKEAEAPRAAAARAQAQARAAQPGLRPSASTRALLQLSVSTATGRASARHDVPAVRKTRVRSRLRATSTTSGSVGLGGYSDSTALVLQETSMPDTNPPLHHHGRLSRSRRATCTSW
jgi:hypothetical protein